MSKSPEERVGYALEQLIQRTVPVYPEDDEITADQRLDEAYSIATDIISRQAEILRSFQLNDC